MFTASRKDQKPRFPNAILLLFLLTNSTQLFAHINGGTGNALQLYSYRLSSPANKPVINGTILSKTVGSTIGTESPDEWKDAYTRAITLNDNTTATIFLVNDDDSLYVALLRPDNNNGDGIGTFLYFDQGIGGAGSHDGLLTGNASTVRNEAGYGIIRQAGSFINQDLSWTGTAWSADADGATDFNGAASILGSATKVEAFEFAIPLHNSKGFSSGNADLQVTSLQQELGLYIRVSRGGADCDSCYWNQTNGNSGEAQTGVGWADVQLNVSRNFTTFYSTFAKNGNPTVDGSITEDAWRGSYRRDIYLTNFNGKVLPTTVYCVQSHIDKTIFLGLKVRDTLSNASDSLQVYYEEKSGDNTTARDYLLETGAEDAVSAKGATARDLQWNGTAWVADVEAADTHQASGTFAASMHQYEMRIPYQGGAQDIGVTDNGLPGFLIRYHDADQPVGSQDFYWEYTVNSDAVRVNQQATPAIFVTSGWANFQLGAPYTQLVFPLDSAAVEGAVNLRLYAEDEDGVTGVDSVKYFRASDTTSKTKLTKIANTGEWSGAWNVGNLTNGLDTLIFRTFDNDGVFVDRLVVLTIANGNSPAAPPTIAFVSPLAGTTLSGLQTFQFTANGGGGVIRKTYVIIDGADTLATTTASTHVLNTVPLVEGAHTLQFLAYNTNGAKAQTQFLTFQVANSPTVSWLSPAGGTVAGGRLILDYDATPLGQATIVSDSLWLDGQGYAVLNLPDGPGTLDIFTLAEGAHTFQVKTTDNAGKTGFSKEVTLLVRNGPWVTLTSPLGNANVSGKVALAYHDSTLVLATVAADSLLLNGKGYQSLSLSGVDTLNSSVLLDGEYTLQVKTTDSHGHVGYSSLITVLVRNNPLARIDSLLADSTVSGTLVIRFAVSAVAPATVAQRLVSIDGAGFRVTSGTSTDTLDTRKLSEGAHTAEVKMVDSQGKEAYSRLVKFNVRNAPNVSIQSPAVDVFVRGIVTVRFTASAVAPDSIAKAEISIGGGDWMSTTTDSTYALDTRLFKDGDLLVQIRVVDGSSKADTTLAREIVVDNAAPKVSYPTVTYGEWVQGRSGARLLVTAQALDFGSGMNRDSAMVLSSKVLTLDSAVLMRDDGLAADEVAGDNVFSAYLSLMADTAGPIPFVLRGRDVLGNDTIVVGGVVLDRTAPRVYLNAKPLPQGADSLNGTVYVPRIILKGNFSDDQGSGLSAVTLVSLNGNGQHIMNSPVTLPVSHPSFSRLLSLVPGLNTLMLIVVDKAGNVDTARAAITYVVPKTTQVVGSDGGLVVSPNGSSIRIPAGALNLAKEISIRPVDPSMEVKPLDATLKLLGIPQEFGPDHTVFRLPAILTITYSEADLDPNQDGTADIQPEDLNIVFWDGRTWVRAGQAELDKANHTLTVAVNHFTMFDLAEDKSVVPTKVVAFWNSNPIRQSQGGVFRFKLPEPGFVSLHILDMSGDLVNTLIPERTTRGNGEWSWIWNGENVSGRFAGAGLYLYVFRFEPASGNAQTLIRKPLGLVKK